MRKKYENFNRLLVFFLFLLIRGVHLENHLNSVYKFNAHQHNACSYLHCEDNAKCAHRKFWCKNPPCPSMIFCAKSKRESSRGPSTCDTVHCSRGYICIVKVRRCRWDERCKLQIARCVSRKEYYDGPASCAGFKCTPGNHCILRESLCLSPPCKLLKSCAKNKDTQIWFSKCRNLGCPSEYECFLRRPDNNCSKVSCERTPDCLTSAEDEITNEHCRGWICPRMQKCFVEIASPCKADICDIKRTCREVTLLTRNSSEQDPSLHSSRSSHEAHEYSGAAGNMSQNSRSPDFSSIIQTEIASSTILKSSQNRNSYNEKSVLRGLEHEARLRKTEDRLAEESMSQSNDGRNHPHIQTEIGQDKRVFDSQNYDAFEKALTILMLYNYYRSYRNIIPYLLHQNLSDSMQFMNKRGKLDFLQHFEDNPFANGKKLEENAGNNDQILQREILLHPFLANYLKHNIEEYTNAKELYESALQSDYLDASRKLDGLKNNSQLYPSTVPRFGLTNQGNQSQRSNSKKQLENSFENSKGENSAINRNEPVSLRRKSVTPSKVILPPYTPSEISLINYLEEIHLTSISDYAQKNLFDEEEGSSVPNIVPKVNNTYEVPYYLLPFGNIEKLLREERNFRTSNEERSEDKFYKVTGLSDSTHNSNNYFTVDEQSTTQNLAILQQALEEHYDFRDEAEIYGKERASMDHLQTDYFYDDIVDSLEEIIKSLQYPSTKNTLHTFKHMHDMRKNQRDSERSTLNSKQVIRDYDWYPVNQLYKYSGALTEENLKKLERRQPSPSKKEEFDNKNRHATIISSLENDPGVGKKSTRLSDRSKDFNFSVARLKHSTGEDNDLVDLLSFIEANKGNILPYVRTFIDVINHDYDSSEDTELYASENTRMGMSSTNYMDNFGHISVKPEISKNATRNVLMGEKYENKESFRRDSSTVLGASENLESTSISSSYVQLNQENIPRTPDPIYRHAQPVIRFFSKMPSYIAESRKSTSREYSNNKENPARKTGGRYEDESNKFLHDYSNYN